MAKIKPDHTKARGRNLVFRCKNCGVSFRSSREFEAHACVADLNDVPLDELMRRYEQERGSK
jgi:tRNA(Ile2) C34 agmatinyltransferase TiaS